MPRQEGRMIRAVRAAAVPVPEIFGEGTLDGRFGIVMQRLDGPTLWQLSRTGAVTFEQAGAIVAALAMSLHKTSPPPEVLSLRTYMESELRHDAGKVPKHLATDILALIDRLSPGDGLCHCDLSPGNVIMTAEGQSSSTGLSRCARPPPSTLDSCMSSFPNSPRK